MVGGEKGREEGGGGAGGGLQPFSNAHMHLPLLANAITAELVIFIKF